GGVDFTFVFPTEIVSIFARSDELDALNARIIGASTDTIHSHLTSTISPIKESGISKLVHPLAADTNHQEASDYGVLIEEDGVALRGLFLINPTGEIQYEVVNHTNIG
ncbi:redoxin domain-containing protein, partial [Listeria monocytogenes]|uniref:redoxin domain-containing protein n=1 Tax=Listeria monocytogenes TaxID=1639 RepID=UPI000AC4889F